MKHLMNKVDMTLQLMGLIFISLLLLDMEPFDERLNLNVWALDHERHAWDGRLAELRRNGPQKLREITEEVLQSERAEYQLPLVGDEEDYSYPR
jgi:hypothetical protein